SCPPLAGTSSRNGAIGAHHKDVFLVGKHGWPARLPQIPACMFAGREGDRRGTINLSGDQHEIRFLGNNQRICRTYLNIGSGVLPVIDVWRSMDQEASVGLNLLELVDQLLA